MLLNKQYFTFPSILLVCTITSHCILQLTAWTNFSVSYLYLCKHFSKKLNKSFRLCYFCKFPVSCAHCIILVPQSVSQCHRLESLKLHEIWVTMPVTIQLPYQLPCQLPYIYHASYHTVTIPVTIPVTMPVTLTVTIPVTIPVTLPRGISMSYNYR